MNIVELCGVNIWEYDVVLVKRLSKPGANKLRHVLIICHLRTRRGAPQEPWYMEG